MRTNYQFHREDLEQVAARMRERAKQPRTCWTAGRPPFVVELLSRAAADNLTTPAQILSGAQQRNICAARWRVIRELRSDQRKFSTPAIGRWLGLHHTTVLNALRVQAKGMGPYAATLPPSPEPYDPDQPDESGAWI